MLSWVLARYAMSMLLRLKNTDSVYRRYARTLETSISTLRRKRKSSDARKQL